MKLEPAISARNLSKSFSFLSERPNSIKTLLVNVARGNFSFGTRNTFQVLNDVSFDIYPGEFVGIMGKNGAGKSTLLKLISGIYTPTQGAVVTRGSIAPLIELGAGFHPELTGLENIFLNASILGFGKKEAEEKLQAIIEFSELGEHIHRPIKNYSSGMLVRLGFSIATQLSSPILLVDEVLAVGDLSFQRKCIKKIEELHKSGRTIILITHDPGAVRTHCQRCIVIDNKRKVFDGPASEGVAIYESKNF
jgi:ABC-type polysaccharide/polyol phosphate transport system ATPase subunit